MGILGLQSTSGIADRIFNTMDSTDSGKVTFEQYLSYMAVIMFGTEDEKSE
jgi:Ca2+-binding EF-hand superfamily protein